MRRRIGAISRRLSPPIVRSSKDNPAGAGRVKPDHQTGDGRLAAAAFADQAEGLAGADREIDAVDRFQELPRLAVDHAVEPGRRDIETAAEVFNPQQRVIGAVVISWVLGISPLLGVVPTGDLTAVDGDRFRPFSVTAFDHPRAPRIERTAGRNGVKARHGAVFESAVPIADRPPESTPSTHRYRGVWRV